MNAPGKRSEISVDGTLYATLSCTNRDVILHQRGARSGSRGGFAKSKIYKVYKHAASRLLSRGTACRVTRSSDRAEERGRFPAKKKRIPRRKRGRTEE